MSVVLHQRHWEKMVQSQIAKFILYILLPPGLFFAFIDRFNNLLQIAGWKSDVAFWTIYITGTITWATNYHFSNQRKQQAIRKEDEESILRRQKIQENDMLLRHDRDQRLFGDKKGSAM